MRIRPADATGSIGERPARRPVRRWALRALAGFAGWIAFVALALVVLAHSLDQPWLKGRIQRLARASAGVDIDYQAAKVHGLSGIEVDGLVVRSPPDVRSFAPDFVRVGRLEARGSLSSLLFGRGPMIERVAASDVEATLVMDEHGRTSLDALSPSKPASGPTVPLSRRASALLGGPPPVGNLEVRAVSLALVRTEGGKVIDRTVLRGLGLSLSATRAEPPVRGWRIEAGLGSPESPLELGLVRSTSESQAAARARLWLTLDASSTAARAALDLRMLEQTFAASVSANHWLHAEVSLRFDPAAGRTEVQLDHTEAGDGAIAAEASIDVPDQGDAVVRRAHGDVDLAQLLRWLPRGLVPFTAERASVRAGVQSLDVGPVVRLAEGGAVTLDASVANMGLDLPGRALQVRSAELSLRAQPTKGEAVAGHGSLKITGAQWVSGDDRVTADDLTFDLDGDQAAAGELTGRLGAAFSRVEMKGSSNVVAAEGHVELHVEGLRPDVHDLVSTRGGLDLTADVGSLDLRSPAGRAVVDRLALSAHSALGGQPPYAFEMHAPASRVRWFGRGGTLLVDAPARLEASAHDVVPDAKHPVATRGVFRVGVDLGDVSASVDATKEVDTIDFVARAAARSLRAARPFLGAALAKEAPWESMAVTLRSTGHVDRIASGAPSIRQTTDVDIERPAFDTVAARSASLTLKSQGTALRHEADLNLRAVGLAFGGGAPVDEHVAISATLDRAQPSLRFGVSTEGRGVTKVSGSLSFDSSRRAVLYAIEGHLASLQPLASFAAKVPGLDAFDLSQLEVGLSARGALSGVVSGIGPDGSFQVAPNPLLTIAVDGQTDIRVSHFRWSKGETAIMTPAIAWHGEMRAAGPRRTLDSRVEVGTLHLDLGDRDVDLNGVTDEATVAVIGSLLEPEIDLTQRLSVRAVEQTVLPEYPLGDLAFTLSAERGPEGVVHVSDMKISSDSGGTVLTLTGNIDLGEGRRTLSVNSSVTQDLERLSTVPERFKGRGKMTVETNVTSPDFAHYHVRAMVKGEDITAKLGRAGYEVETANGEVPVTVALEVGDSGVTLQRTEKRSPYSMLRFADQHPLLTRSGFLSIVRLKTPFVSIAPLVGNLEIEQNVISLRQFEMGVRGGTITGQCGIDWDGPKSTFEVHVRANGVQSSHGEPFDGNIAVAISLADRTIDGRAEILRIGERHLLDLLDLQDPLHVDPAMNRIRAALVFGYPDNLKLVFDHGFASAHLELGGLARLVSIGELRGIPMGPIVDKMLAPVLEGANTKEPP
jgi:translocation and assembly module TamB